MHLSTSATLAVPHFSPSSEFDTSLWTVVAVVAIGMLASVASAAADHALEFANLLAVAG